MDESIARATATAGGAVLFAGGTVVIALCSLARRRDPARHRARLHGRRRGRRRRARRRRRCCPRCSAPSGRGSTRCRVQLRPHAPGRPPAARLAALGRRRGRRGRGARSWPASSCSLVLADPVLDLHLGQSDVGALPKSTTARQAYDGMSESFGAGTNGPLLVSVRLGSPAKADDPRLADLRTRSRRPTASSRSPRRRSTGRHARRLHRHLRHRPVLAETEDLVNELRDRVIPAPTRATT